MLQVVVLVLWLAGALVVLASLTPGARSSRELAVVVLVAVGWPLVLLGLAWAIIVGGDES